MLLHEQVGRNPEMQDDSILGNLIIWILILREPMRKNNMIIFGDADHKFDEMQYQLLKTNK